MSIRLKLASASAAVLLATTATVLPVTTAAAAPASAAPAAASVLPFQAKKTAPTSLPVTGTLADGTAFTGAISDLTATSTKGGVMQLTGTITGNGLPAGGTTFTTPIENLAAPAGCSVLNLDLGPLNLDLLGLVIDLAPVKLDITAVPGSGKLLGNLLCAVTHLLDKGGPLSGLTNLLNRLLSVLGL
ncbi:ABC transporter substrate-binding protein [Nakamurella aerolata]|uniref:ABC transporter substrate-binding protein n=1 Tax=Nakamurella aerolata TaxID=1656892 RepID=A0A849AD83_9ACTN|nr:ABC transporter substrate-binding protein [Nakamurella aerolata]NNG37161.1 ABC transporter substrate-binding protein [Nakamurella aerolata]